MQFPFFKRKRSHHAPHPFDLDYVLLHLSDHPADTFCLGDLYTSVNIFGTTGSGKTTGPGANLALALLESGYGGLVLTTKPGECLQWKRWCELTGRLDDLLVIDESAHYRFNFMQYEGQRASRGGGLTSNLVALFLNVMEATEAGRSNSQDQFWRLAVKQLMRNCIDLLQMAGQDLTMSNLRHLVMSAPDYPDQLKDPFWAERSYCRQCLDAANLRTTEPDARIDYQEIERYWLQEVPSQDDRTRSNVFQTFSVMADGFCRGLFRKLFSTDTTITPDQSIDGKIIVVDLPVKSFSDSGLHAQVIFKQAWQKTMERRDLKTQPNPVFLYVDEAQEFITSSDAMFQATARSSGVGVVYLTQSITGYYARLGGSDGKHSAEAFLANMATRIFCASGCPETNRWAEDLFNKTWRYRGHSSMSFNQDNGQPKKLFSGPPKPSISAGVNPSNESQIPATVFTKLKNGGPRNNFAVQTLIFQTSRVWAHTRANYLPVTFMQEF